MLSFHLLPEQDVCRITADDENSFEQNHSEHIDRYINVNDNKEKSFLTANLNRINNESIYTREITLEEIKTYYKVKKESSGFYQNK